MTGKAWALAISALLISGPALADNARRRDGGAGGSAGDRHHGGASAVPHGGSFAQSGGGAVQRGGGSGGGRRVSGAEARHPVAGTGHGSRGGRYGYYPYYYGGYPYYWYSPYYYDGWYGAPYLGFYWNSWSYAAPYWGAAYAPPAYRETGAIRTLVEPSKAKVYVDGYYAGVADDFDGMFQRLQVAPGRHDITLELEGYRSVRVKVYVMPDQTVKIRLDMEKGSGEAAVVDMTGGREAPPYRLSRDEGYPPREGEGYPPREGSPPREGQGSPPREGERAEVDRGALEPGTLRVEVRPEDASIYVDGQFFGIARRATSVTLAPGMHRIEVVRPGFRTLERDVEVRPGRTETLTIELERS